jgi:hypothetical protein
MMLMSITGKKAQFISVTDLSLTDDGTVTFEINNGWYLYDENEYLDNILNLTEGTFKPVMYLTFMYCDHTWKRN